MSKLVYSQKLAVEEDVSVILADVLCKTLHLRGHVQSHAYVVTDVHKDEDVLGFCFPLSAGKHKHMIILVMLVCWHAL